MAEASATAEGELARTPFAHLLVYALDRRLTGAMLLTPAEGTEHVIRLVRGVPVKVRPGDRFALLGEMLIEAGAIDDATLQAALATQGLLGDVLLLAGRIERDVLEKVAEAQFVRRMVRLFALPAATGYRYYDGLDELADHGGDPAGVDPLALIWAGLRAHGEASSMMDGTLARLGEAPLRLHAATSVARFGLDAAETKLVDALTESPLTLGELAVAFPAALARRFTYALAITRQLELGTGLLPLGVDAAKVADPPSSGPPSSLPPGAPAPTAVARMTLRSTVHRVGAAAPDAPGDGERPLVVTSRRARERPASDVPPSSSRTDAPPISSVEPVPSTPRAPSSGVVMVPIPTEEPSAPSTPKVASVEEPISSAATTLRSETDTSQEAPEVTTAGEATDPFEGMSQPEIFWLATEMLADRDAAGAAEACAEGRKKTPDDPDLIALGAWAQAQLGGADLKTLTVELDEVLGSHEAHVEARYYRAMLRRRLGDEAGWLRDLERVAEIAPEHEGAARELATVEAKPSEKEERPGLLGRLFKR